MNTFASFPQETPASAGVDLAAIYDRIARRARQAGDTDKAEVFEATAKEIRERVASLRARNEHVMRAKVFNNSLSLIYYRLARKARLNGDLSRAGVFTAAARRISR